MKVSNAVRIAIIYSTISLVYITFSDYALVPLGLDREAVFLVSVAKGYLFVILTAVLLYYLVGWGERRLLESERRISDLNHEMSRNEVESQLARLDSIGHLAADLAHDLNNSLTIMQGNLAVIQDKAAHDADVRDRFRSIDIATERARSLANALLSFSKGGEPILEVTNLGKFIPEITAPSAGWIDIGITFDLPSNLPMVMADRNQLQHVLKNIFLNAKDAMPQGGTISINGKSVVLEMGEIAGIPQGNYVRIDIHDSGTGIHKKDLGRVFDLFFTTKKDAKGIGLSMAQNIVRNHGGIILADSVIGHGATFSILLPAYVELPDQMVREKKRAPVTGKVLWMDDEEEIRDIGKDLLGYLGYRAEVASDGQQAIDMFRAAMEDDPFSAVILDLTIPNGMGGAEAFRQMMTIDPDVRGIVCSGYSNDPIMANHLEHGFSAVLPKPFRLEMLKSVLDRTLS